MYQDHPSFVKDAEGRLVYGALNEDELEMVQSLDDLKKTATRRLVASDYAYAIKRKTKSLTYFGQYARVYCWFRGFLQGDQPHSKREKKE
jgi:hypothetical protein